jgi:hypothetical protein
LDKGFFYLFPSIIIYHILVLFATVIGVFWIGKRSGKMIKKVCKKGKKRVGRSSDK